jgi:alkylation response protein AidB-like acyl-CoA dehydrogenase
MALAERALGGLAHGGEGGHEKVVQSFACGELGAESSVTKVFWSDLDVALHQTALDLRGPGAELAGAWSEGLLFALGGPIYAGTNEVQRNIIAERLLGLPREAAK